MFKDIPRFAGKIVEIGDQMMVLPKMSFSIRRLEEAARKALQDGATGFDADAKCAEIVFLTLQRNYPSMTREQFDDVADIVQCTRAYAMLRLMEQEGVDRVGKEMQVGPIERNDPTLSRTISSSQDSSVNSEGASSSGSESSTSIA